MSAVFGDAIRRIATVDLFKRSGNGRWETGLFVGRPFYLDYEKAFTRYEFSFSGLECRILGTFFVENSEKVLQRLDLKDRAVHLCRPPRVSMPV